MDTSQINKIEDTTNLLRDLLIQFRESVFFKENKRLYQSMIPNIEIVIALTEKGIYGKRAINKEEEFWFEGDRFVEEAFNFRDSSEYKMVSVYYVEIVDFVNKHNFFR